MEKITVKLEADSTRALQEQAALEKRPLKYQAEIALRRGLGLKAYSEATS